MTIIKKYLRKDIYLQKKNWKVLMILDQYNRKIIEDQKPAETTGDLIANKVADEITNISEILQQNNLETIANEYHRAIPKERYISPEEKQKVIDNVIV